MTGPIGPLPGIDSTQLEQMRAKMQEMQQARFNDSDANGDGVLDATELDSMKSSSPFAGQGPDAATLISELDADGNGGLSIEELQSQFERLSSQMKASLVDFQAAGFAQPTDAGSANTQATQLQQLYEQLLSALDGDEEGDENTVETVDIEQTV